MSQTYQTIRSLKSPRCEQCGYSVRVCACSWWTKHRYDTYTFLATILLLVVIAWGAGQ